MECAKLINMIIGIMINLMNFLTYLLKMDKSKKRFHTRTNKNMELIEKPFINY